MKTFCLFGIFLLCVTSASAQVGTKSPSNTSTQPKAEATRPRRLSFETAEYSVKVSSVEKKAHNYWVTLIFENLTNRTIKIKWLSKSWSRRNIAPYLVDEKSNKYVLQSELFDGILGDEVYGGREVLAGTNLKLRYLFFGAGKGEVFDIIATDYSTNRNGKPVVIRGLKVTSNEDSLIPSPDKPAVATESYRVVVESAQREGNSLILTLVFESLADQPFELAWGHGYYEGPYWRSREPYLIDENADRFYTSEQDTGKVVSRSREAKLLPKTKLKTQIVFNVEGNGTVFTLACRESRPKQGRSVVIQGIKVNGQYNQEAEVPPPAIEPSAQSTTAQNEGELKVYASSSEGTLFTNPVDDVAEVTFYASGRWAFWPAQGFHSADGHPNYLPASKSGPNYKLPEVAIGSLIVLRANGKYEYVGKEKTFTLNPTERVFFVMNDSQKYGRDYEDNEGVITVKWKLIDKPAVEISSIPVVINIEGTTGIVGTDPVLKITYRDRECDVINGRWESEPRSGLSDTLRTNGSCARGEGVIYYKRTCHWAGRWREYITLRDAQGHSSSKYEYTYTCTK